MSRWSLSNILLPISASQFRKLTTEFHAAAQASLGESCNLNITLMREPKLYTTFLDDEIQAGLDYENRANTILSTSQLSDITREIWAKAGYAEVSISPSANGSTPPAGWAHIEFKGERPRQATYYFHSTGPDIKDLILSQNRGKWIGDGFNGNGERSVLIPSPLGAIAF